MLGEKGINRERYLYIGAKFTLNGSLVLGYTFVGGQNDDYIH